MSALDRIKYLYWSIIPYDYRPGQLWYRFKCWTWHRYSTVKPRQLPHTWVDRTELMPHMIFEILSDFIEKECGENCHIDWYHEGGHKIEVNGKKVNVRDEMQDLYDWWHDDYLVNKDGIMDEWYEHRRSHVHDVFSRVFDHEILEWIKEVGPGASEEEIEELETQYSSPEAKVENDRLFAEANKRTKHYKDELNSRLHRVINIIPYMWT